MGIFKRSATIRHWTWHHHRHLSLYCVSRVCDKPYWVWRRRKGLLCTHLFLRLCAFFLLFCIRWIQVSLSNRYEESMFVRHNTQLHWILFYWHTSSIPCSRQNVCDAFVTQKETKTKKKRRVGCNVKTCINFKCWQLLSAIKPLEKIVFNS